MSVMASTRAALRGAISEREAAKVRLLNAKQAEQRGHDLYFARKQELAFADVDLAIVQFQTEALNHAATGAPSLDSGLPGDLVARRAILDQARERVRQRRPRTIVWSLISLRQKVRYGKPARTRLSLPLMSLSRKASNRPVR